jgi:hypothetical protein
LAIDQEGQGSFGLFGLLFEHLEGGNGTVNSSRMRLAMRSKSVSAVEVATAVDVGSNFFDLHAAEIG